MRELLSPRSNERIHERNRIRPILAIASEHHGSGLNGLIVSGQDHADRLSGALRGVPI